MESLEHLNCDKLGSHPSIKVDKGDAGTTLCALCNDEGPGPEPEMDTSGDLVHVSISHHVHSGCRTGHVVAPHPYQVVCIGDYEAVEDDDENTG